MTGSDDRYRELLSVLGHELRSPLTVVRGVATLLLDSFDDLPRERRVDMLRLIDQHVEAMSDRIEDLLAVCNLDAGDVRLVMQDVSAGALLQHAAQRAVRRANGHPVQALPVSGDVDVEADWERSLQVLNALIANAVRFSPAEAPVELRAAPVGDAVRFEVLDRGPGVPAQLREQIFKRLGRIAPEGGGAGLGLYMVRGLARAMGGEAGSEPRPDGGSIFWFTLKRRDGR